MANNGIDILTYAAAKAYTDKVAGGGGGGGGVTEIDIAGVDYQLTSDSGMTVTAEQCGFYKIYNSGASAKLKVGPEWYITLAQDAEVSMMLGRGVNGLGYGIYAGNGFDGIEFFVISANLNHYRVLTTNDLADNLVINAAGFKALDGHQGKVLADRIATQGNTLATSAPTTSTKGVLGQLYTDTTNMHTYQCTAISGSTYTWTQRW